ncbi:MAG: hypothetical protein WCF84_13635 [Anaerolineae bacterium]
MPLSGFWFEKEKDIPHPSPLVFVVHPLRLAAANRQGLPDVRMQFDRFFVKTNYRVLIN